MYSLYMLYNMLLLKDNQEKNQIWQRYLPDLEPFRKEITQIG